MAPVANWKAFKSAKIFFLAYDVQILYDGVQQRKKNQQNNKPTNNSFVNSKAGVGAEDNFPPLFEKTHVWQIVEFFFVCNRIRVYCKDHNLCYWLRWAPSVSGDVQYPCPLNSCTQGAAQKDLQKQMQALKAVAKSRGKNSERNAMFSADILSSWGNPLVKQELYKILGTFWFLLIHSLTSFHTCSPVVCACYEAGFCWLSLWHLALIWGIISNSNLSWLEEKMGLVLGLTWR